MLCHKTWCKTVLIGRTRVSMSKMFSPGRETGGGAHGVAGQQASAESDDTSASFALVDEELTWRGAREACRTQFNGDLASVHSGQEQNAVGLLCNGATSYGPEGSETAEANFYKACWIGLTDVAEEGSWVWSDDEPLEFGTGEQQQYMFAVPLLECVGSDDCAPAAYRTRKQSSTRSFRTSAAASVMQPRRSLRPA